ncbi:MAG TPA: type II secretion system protein GspD [Candidatus Marinimicrobia bacterium]|nr:type II secretion system protein GspD [Candidatus Neomarinimicrobiota bacterium]
MIRKIVYAIVIFSIIWAQQRPPASATRRPPASATQPASGGKISSLRDLDFEVLKLSYIQTDRALAILKTLGYSVVEFKAAKGEIRGEFNFTPQFSNKNTNLNAPGALPIIIKLPDTETISLVEKSTSKAASKKSALGVDLGGVTLDNTTSGEPMQRLLVGYKPTDYNSVARLIDLVKNKIDVPANQIVIEALIIELNTENLNELGVDFSNAGPGYSAVFPPPEGGSISPFTVVLDRTLLGSTSNFRANIEALISSKDAKILSKPSVLVLDGRQARIQIGQQIPIVKTTDTQISQTRSVDYIPVGIVLNLRPRISADGSRVTIQIETIISETEERIGAAGSGAVETAPIINNRKVQSFVRVANNTPFIIGGLISEKKTLNEGGVPILRSIPWLGRLFQISTQQRVQKEVIVVITPHIITETEDNFSRVIPQDSDLFNAFGNKSFPNSYRVTNDDVFDLNFIYDSPVFKDIIAEVKKRSEKDKTLLVREPYKSILESKIPGEDILIRKMLTEIIEKLEYSKHIDPMNVIYFLDSSSDPAGFKVAPLATHILETPEGHALQLSYTIKEATVERPFVRPTAEAKYITIPSDSYKNVLRGLNKRGADPTEDIFTILISSSKDEIELYEVLVMKRVLEMNPDLELTFKYFQPGIEILFPSPNVLLNNTHVVDRDAAKFYYEVNDYYGSFEEEFNRQTAELGRLIQEKN